MPEHSPASIANTALAIANSFAANTGQKPQAYCVLVLGEKGCQVGGYYSPAALEMMGRAMAKEAAMIAEDIASGRNASNAEFPDV
jgi:hypothetical protein